MVFPPKVADSEKAFYHSSSDWYSFLDLVVNTAFALLPVLVAISAARVFGGNVFLGAVIGLMMVHPALINAWTVGNYAAGELRQPCRGKVIAREEVVQAIEREQPRLCFHLGDGERDAAALQRRFPELPLYAVRGNCDLRSALSPTLDCAIGGVPIFATHGHLFQVKYEPRLDSLTQAARDRGARLALFGHTPSSVAAARQPGAAESRRRRRRLLRLVAHPERRHYSRAEKRV